MRNTFDSNYNSSRNGSFRSMVCAANSINMIQVSSEKRNQHAAMPGSLQHTIFGYGSQSTNIIYPFLHGCMKAITNGESLFTATLFGIARNNFEQCKQFFLNHIFRIRWILE